MSHLGYLRGTAGRRPRRTLAERLADLRRPAGLGDLMLRGARPATPVRIVIARDVSGSMIDFADARERAFEELLPWAAANLRPTDELGVLDFADEALWSLRPAPVHRLAMFGARLIDTQLAGGTAWRPVLDRVRSLGDHSGRLSLWLVSDGEYPDYPESCDTGRRLLTDAGVTSMPLLIPSRSGSAPGVWQDIFPDEVCLPFEGMDARATALAFAFALASATGQRLVRVGGTQRRERIHHRPTQWGSGMGLPR